MEFLQWRNYLLSWKYTNISKHILYYTLPLTVGKFKDFDRNRRIGSVTIEIDVTQSKRKGFFSKTAPKNRVQQAWGGGKCRNNFR